MAVDWFGDLVAIVLLILFVPVLAFAAVLFVGEAYAARERRR